MRDAHAQSNDWAFYRCHTKGCATKTIREERVSEAISQQLKQLKLTASELRYFDSQIAILRERWQETRRKLLESQQVRQNTIVDRLNRLTDAFIDGHLDKESFDTKKTALLLERREIEDHLGKMQSRNIDVPSAIGKNLELIKTAYSLHKVAFSEEQREIVESVTSNRFIGGKSVEIPFKFPFSEVARMRGGADGGAPKVSSRTFCRKVLLAIQKYCENIHFEQVPAKPCTHERASTA